MKKRADKKTLWTLFKSMFVLSACTFGGGFVIVSLMKKKFVDKGIPLVLGEYSAMYRTHPDNSLQEVCHESEGYFTGYVTEQAKNNGLAPFLWDIQHGGLFDRSTGTILLPTVYNQLKEGAERGQYPF